MNILSALKGQQTPQPTIKSPHQLDMMRQAGAIAAHAVALALKHIQPGNTTQHIDTIAHDEIIRLGAKPAFLGLYGFPATACISVNEEIVHGIPGERQLQNGDIVSIDCGAIVDGMYSDMARTAVAGTATQDAQDLIQYTRDALDCGIRQARAGNRVGDISSAVAQHAELKGYGVVREYVGHGIGAELHEPPQVPNFGDPGKGPLLKIGMVLAIEPMFTTGDWNTKVLQDNWTVVTQDGSMAAHFEDTVLIAEHGAEVLTRVQEARNN